MNDPPTDEKKGPIAPQHWIGRQEVSIILRCSFQTVCNLEKKGVLSPLRSKDGLMRHDPDRVAAVAEKYEPRAGRPIKRHTHLNENNIDAVILDNIDRGMSPAQIARMLRISVDQVHRTWQKSTLDFGDPAYVSDEDLKWKRRKEAALIRANREIEAKTIELQTALVSGKAPRKKRAG
jgi:hypothetical protein